MRLKIFSMFIFMLFFIGCATNPVTGVHELKLVSNKQEISVGNEQYKPGQQLQGGEYILDKNLSKYIDRVGKKLAAVSDRDLPYEFKILNNSTPNAWALPGGKIAINRGLLTELHSESELAAVLSHEIVHAAARHGAKNMERGLFLQAAVIATAIVTQEEDYNLLAVGGAQLVSGLITQKYSRSAELEADLYGMRYMARAGYDPQGAVDLQRTFLQLAENKEPNWLSGLFASHPPSFERLQANQQTAIELGVTGKTDDKIYKKNISYLIKTAPAYDKYDKARLSFKKNNIDNAITLVDQALKIEPDEALFHGLTGDIHFKKKKFHSAIKAYDKAIELNDKYFYFFEKRGLAYKQIGNQTKAKKDLYAGSYLLPTAISYNALGQIALNQGNKQEAKKLFLTASSSKTGVGEKASTSYVKLDLPDNPKKYIQIRRKHSDGKKARFMVINKSILPVHNIFLKIRFNDRQGKKHKMSHKIRHILHPEEHVTVLIGPKFVPAAFQDSIKISLVSVEIME